ncbi:MAG: hypothetical protein O3B13_18725, partial [Planctomycetota bacterium]|nr:hypothetical protein [Planctomycetota bacterium]
MPLRPRHTTASLLTLRIACILTLFMQTQCGLSADDQQQLRTILRRPIAMVQADHVLYVANRDTGSISVVDSASGVVLNEVVVSSRLDDLAILSSSRTLLAVNSESHELIVLQMFRDAARVPGIRKKRSEGLAKYPVSIVSAPDGERASCVSKWSRRLTVIDANTFSFERTLRKFVDLPFVPLRQCFLNDRLVLVADAHGGELAIVDAAAGELISHQKLIGHNIRGLAVTD